MRRRASAQYGPQGAYGQPVSGSSGCDRIDGYRVTYEYAGRRYESVTDYHPGQEMRVRIELAPR